MNKRKINLAVFFTTLFLFISGIILASQIDTNFGTIIVKTVEFDNDGLATSGLLYQPKIDDFSTKLPAVVLMHGVMNAKETMNCIGLELAKNGIIALSIDAIGHGNSEGKRSETDDSTLGGFAAIGYLEKLSYVDKESIALIGHSMGAGAMRSTAYKHANITATILIGGAIGWNSSTVDYGILDPTFPKNLLVAIGRSDELFDIEEVLEELKPIFNTTENIQKNKLYGDFASQNARKIILPNTIHLFEPINREIVIESVNWMLNSFDPEIEQQEKITARSLTYIYRDILLLFSLFIGILFVFSIVSIMKDFIWLDSLHETVIMKQLDFGEWKIGLLWGLVHMIAFVPATLLGFSFSIIPLSYGTMAILWVLINALFGFFIIYFKFNKKGFEMNFIKKLKEMLKNGYIWRSILIAAGWFTIFFVLLTIIEMTTHLNFKMIIPLFTVPNPMRIVMFLIFFPFFLIYFYIDGYILSQIHINQKKVDNIQNKVWNGFKIVAPKLIPFLVTLLIVYIPLLFFNIRILSGSIAFTLQFVFIIVVLFIIYIINTTWFYRNTNTVESGAILNTLLFAWTLAALLPFS